MDVLMLSQILRGKEVLIVISCFFSMWIYSVSWISCFLFCKEEIS